MLLTTAAILFITVFGKKNISIRNVETFQESKRRVFSGGSLRVTWIKKLPFADEPGNKTSLYVSLFDAIQSKSGVKMIYEHEEVLQEDFDVRGLFQKASERLASGVTDVILGQTLVNATPHVEFGPVFYNDKLYVIAPKPQSLKVHRNLFKIFSPQLYASLVTAHLAVAIFYGAVTKGRPAFQIGLISRYRSLLILFAFYFIFRIILEAAYVGKLSSVFGTPSKTLRVTDPMILYVHEFHVYKTWYAQTAMTGRYVITNKDWELKFVRNLNETERALIELAADAKNYATSVVFKSGCKTHPSQMMAADAFDFIPGANYFDTFYLRKGNFLNEIVKYWAQEIIERGLFEKWWDDMVLNSRNFTLERSAVETDDGTAAFTLSHYQEVFGVLLVGDVGALMIFAMEFGAKMIEQKIDRMRRYSPV